MKIAKIGLFALLFANAETSPIWKENAKYSRHQYVKLDFNSCFSAGRMDEFHSMVRDSERWPAITQYLFCFYHLRRS